MFRLPDSRISRHLFALFFYATSGKKILQKNLILSVDNIKKTLYIIFSKGGTLWLSILNFMIIFSP